MPGSKSADSHGPLLIGDKETDIGKSGQGGSALTGNRDYDHTSFPGSFTGIEDLFGLSAVGKCHHGVPLIEVIEKFHNHVRILTVKDVKVRPFQLMEQVIGRHHGSSDSQSIDPAAFFQNRDCPGKRLSVKLIKKILHSCGLHLSQLLAQIIDRVFRRNDQIHHSPVIVMLPGSGRCQRQLKLFQSFKTQFLNVTDNGSRRNLTFPGKVYGSHSQTFCAVGEDEIRDLLIPAAHIFIFIPDF